MTIEPLMPVVIPTLLVVVAVALSIAAVRLLRGPSLVDRIIAMDMLVIAAVAVTALATMATGRREFLDVGLGIAVIGFVATCAFAAFLEQRTRAARQEPAAALSPPPGVPSSDGSAS
jgi:multisubunit Na+/H+ antiporter MnhF subunit